MRVLLKLYGVFRSAAKVRETYLELPDQRATIRSAIEQLTSRDDLQGLKLLLVDTVSSDPRPNALIMVSGREINSLNGLDTEVTAKDEIAFLPVAHGG